MSPSKQMLANFHLVWSTGIGVNPFVKKIKGHLPEQQNNQRAIIVDSHLRVKGIEDDSVYALGDCSTIEVPKLLSGAVNLFEQADTDKSGSLSRQEFEVLTKKVSKYNPIVGAHFSKIDEQLFHSYGGNSDQDGLTIDQFQKLLADADKTLTSLPPTAQVASQEGYYLGKEFSTLAARLKLEAEGSLVTEVKNTLSLDSKPELVYQKKDEKGNVVEDLSPKPFRYRHLGSFVYIGDENAVFDLGLKGWTTSGYGTFWLWRSVFLNEQVSLRTRTLIAFDWFKTLFFGRDVSKVK
jgi:NADH dehydrogenase